MQVTEPLEGTFVFLPYTDSDRVRQINGRAEFRMTYDTEGTIAMEVSMAKAHAARVRIEVEPLQSGMTTVASVLIVVSAVVLVGLCGVMGWYAYKKYLKKFKKGAPEIPMSNFHNF